MWPKQSELSRYYGNPDANHDGLPDRVWEQANLVGLKPAYRMVLAWDPKTQLRTIRVHKKCAASLERVLEGITKLYPSQEAIEQARMHLYGGAYAFRLMRGGHKLSVHSYGAAIDLDPEQNGFGDATFTMPMPVVELFEAEGWVWGGRWAKKDAMHYQAARME